MSFSQLQMNLINFDHYYKDFCFYFLQYEPVRQWPTPAASPGPGGPPSSSPHGPPQSPGHHPNTASPSPQPLQPPQSPQVRFYDINKKNADFIKKSHALSLKDKVEIY